MLPLTLATWTAHAGEITNIEYHQSSNTFVLSSSYDCNVKLWTFKGELIGTFGQVICDLKNKRAFYDVHLIIWFCFLRKINGMYWIAILINIIECKNY